MNYIVWVKDGGSWRILAAYATKAEQARAAKVCKADGEKVKVCVRGDATDLKLRGNVHSK